MKWSGNPGELSGFQVASITPDVNAYHTPWLLCSAFQDGTVDSSGMDEQRNFFFASDASSTHNLWENWSSGADEKWFRGNENGFGNDWYFVLPNGELYEWDSQRSATGSKLADLGPNAWNNIEGVGEDYHPALDQTQTDALAALDQKHSLFRASNDTDFFFNALGQQEKWLRGNDNSSENDWYFFFPNYTLLEWNGSHYATGNALATDLPPSVYDNPLLLADIFADGSVLNNAVPLNPFQPNDGGSGDRLN